MASAPCCDPPPPLGFGKAGLDAPLSEESVPNLGMGELLIILLIVLLVFGAGRLPQIGEGIGKAVRNLKRGLNSDEDIDVQQSRQVEGPQQPSARREISDADVVDRKNG